jgi:flagellar biosynthetic protein FliR
MRVEVPLGTVLGFLLVLTRVSGAFVFLPLPGVRSGPDMARAALSLGLTMALYPFWPQAASVTPSPGQLLAWLASEAAFGIAAGVIVALLGEAFQVGAQIIGLQAGYSYASTIDPTSEADSNVLQVFTQMAGALLFFAFGMDRQVLRVFAHSLQVLPPGAYQPARASAESVIRLGSAMLTTGFRLALPVVALMVLVDVTLALMSKINAHLQMLTLAFPAKMLVTLATLAALTAIMSRLYEGAAIRALTTMAGLTRN